MAGREIALYLGILAAVLIAAGVQYRDGRKIENPSPPPPEDGAMEASERGERPIRGGRSRVDVDHRCNPAPVEMESRLVRDHADGDCPISDDGCVVCRGKAPERVIPGKLYTVYVQADLPDEDDVEEECDDSQEEMPPAGFRGWLSDLKHDIIHGGPNRR